MARTPKACPICKKVFVPPVGNKEQTYCSAECYRNRENIRAYRRIPRICPVCEDSFIPSVKNKGQTYCSRECFKNRGSAITKTAAHLTYSERVFKGGIENSVSQILHTGFPDFLIERDGKLIFVEVKARGGVLQKNQVEVMDLLSSHGFECFISYRGSIDLIPFSKIKPVVGKFVFSKIESIISKLEL